MPEKIGHYTIVSQLGRGGMGVVYKAHEESLNRFVAIKVLTEGLTEDQTFLQRFVREAQAAAGLSHPNIVQIFFIGEDGGHPFFVMEYVTGRSLNHILREEGRIGNPRAAQMILQAAHGLAAAHDKGIIHRDIKPANLILDDRGLLKIADFGLALPVDAENRLTATGMMVGTPGYLAPEQCRGEKVDHRTDIYALGVTFYQLLTGTPPFRGESPLALMRQILDEEPPDVSTLAPDVDAETKRIVAKMLHKDREQRYQDCHQLVADLEEFIASRGVRSMTAGLATRVPTTSADPSAMAAATLVVNAATTTKAADVPTTITGTKPAAPVPLMREPDTTPEPPYAGPPTVPPVANYIPPPAAAAPKSSSTGLMIALAIILVLGGGTAAALVGMKMYRGWKGGDAPVATSNSSTTTATQAAAVTPPPAPGQLLSDTKQVEPSQASVGGQVPSTVVPVGSVQNNVSTGGAPVAPPAATPSTGGTPVASQAAQGSTRRPIPQTVATPERTPPPQRAARRASGVAVAVVGDPNLTGAMTSVINSELSAAGLDVVDASTLPSTEDLVRGGDVSASRLISRLRDEGYAVLVIARAEPSGQRELKYMGRYDTAYSSRITITTYDLATGRPFGTPGRGSIEYTTINAERETDKVVGKLARASAEAIQGH